MIRRLIGRAVAIWESDHTTIAVNALLIGLSLKAIQEVIDRRSSELAAINAELAAARTARAELVDEQVPPDPYPGPDDLAPLGTGGEDDRG